MHDAWVLISGLRAAGDRASAGVTVQCMRGSGQPEHRPDATEPNSSELAAGRWAPSTSARAGRQRGSSPHEG